MNKPYRYIVPMALGTILTACSNQSVRDETSTQLTIQTPISSSVHQAVTNIAMEENLDQLHVKLAQNFDQIAKLAKQLDDKEKALSDLMSGYIDASTLMTIQRLGNERDELELAYNQLHQDNDRLTSRIRTLQAEPQTFALQNVNAIQDTSQSNDDTDFVQLNRDYRTLSSAHFALSKNYRDLSIEHAHLKSQLDSLVDQNKTLSSDYSTLSNENHALAATLSDARAQHQLLWDKIRVQTDVINTLQANNAELLRSGSFVVAANTNSVEVPDAAKLMAQITRLKAELTAQNTLITNYQKDVSQLESALSRQEKDLTGKMQSLESRYKDLTERHQQSSKNLAELREDIQFRNDRIETLQKELASSSEQKSSLLEELKQLRVQYLNSQKQIEALETQAQSEAEQKQVLQNQVNNLIPFEGAVMSLQRQLQSELTNVHWTLPTSANLHDTFEIQFTADVANPVQGQTYYAELFVDSALSMMSAAEAESSINQGQVNFRWRLSGLNERPNATMNVSVTQEVNYDGQVILRKIYRDTESVELISKDWLNKYGFWVAAILGGLLIGFAAGKLGRRSQS